MSNALITVDSTPPPGALALPSGSKVGAWFPKESAPPAAVAIINAVASPLVFAQQSKEDQEKLVDVTLQLTAVQMGRTNAVVDERDAMKLADDVLEEILTYYPRITVEEIQHVFKMGATGRLSIKEDEFSGVDLSTVAKWLRRYHEQHRPAALEQAIPPEVKRGYPQGYAKAVDLPPDHPAMWLQFGFDLAMYKAAPSRYPLFVAFARWHVERLVKMGLVTPSKAPEPDYAATLKKYLAPRTPNDIFDEVRIYASQYFDRNPFKYLSDGSV